MREEPDHIYAAGAAGAPLRSVRCEPAPPLHTPHSDHSLLWVRRIRLGGAEGAPEQAI